MRHAGSDSTRKKALLPTLAAMALLGAGVAAFASPAAAADAPLCGTTPATIVVPAGTTTPVDGTAGDDVIYVNGAATINALGGNDVVCEAPGATATTGGTWDGGEGDDTMSTVSAELVGGPGNDTLAAGYSTISGGAGDDVLRGGAGENTLNGGDGDDRLTGGVGVDILDGGLGNDTFATSRADRLRVGGPTRTTVDATAMTIEGPDGADTYTGRPPVFWAPGDTDELFIGSNGVDVFTSDGGHDRVYGQDGNDRITAVHPLLVDGGAGDDLIEARFGGVVRGSAGNDTIRTSLETVDHAGVTGEPFDLSGGGGNDVVVASSMSTDGVVSVPTDPALRWTGTVRGGAGSDRVEFGPAGYSVVADLVLGNKATWAAGQMTLQGVQALTGTDKRDVLRGGPARDVLIGGGGDDVLAGRGGNDVLTGGDGQDRARGGAGRDACSAEISKGC
jgi:Ca2+-binding RTX toxin-like protein